MRSRLLCVDFVDKEKSSKCELTAFFME